MRRSLFTIAFSAASVLLIISGSTIWAASPVGGAALSHYLNTAGNSKRSQAAAASRSVESKPSRGTSVPRVARFREVEGRGLLLKTWINGSGPYTFAVDTGAGATVISRRVAREARVNVTNRSALTISGLSGAAVTPGWKAVISALAIGDAENFLPSQGSALVVDRLPSGVDGILDPTEAYWPLGYTIDMPHGELSAFDPCVAPLRVDDLRSEGVVVAWLRENDGRRPFVMLAGGRRALLDTGSGYGLAVNEDAARAIGIQLPEDRGGKNSYDRRDVAGGVISVQRIRPATVYIGSLALRRVPTDFLSNIKPGAPVLLGRDALRPFRCTFDPSSRLIHIRPA